jgi:hypothetical protein
MSINLQYVAIGVMNTAVGLRMLVEPQHFHTKIDKRKTELDAGAPERFFEERRTLVAYPPPASVRGWRFKGTVLMLLGIACVSVSFFRPS